MASGQVTIKTTMDTTSAVKQVKNLDTALGTVSSSLGTIGKLMASAFSVYYIVNFVKQATNLASALEEVQNVVDVAFGDMKYKVEGFADTAIESFGMSELTAKQMASTFLAMGNGMGQGLEIGSDKAIELTGRLADVASFYNKTMNEVNTIGRAIYSGETEPLKAIGIVMTQDNLDAYTMAQGYDTLYTKMDQANKLLVRQEYFLHATGQAAGDFLRTQYSWANQTRMLGEQFKAMQAVWGEAFINLGTLALPVINSIIEGMVRLGNVAVQVSEIIYSLFTGQSLSDVNAPGAGAGMYEQETAAIEGATDAQDGLTAATEETADAQKRSLAGFDTIQKLSSSDSADTSSLADSLSGITTSEEESMIDSTEIVDEINSVVAAFEYLADKIYNLFSPEFWTDTIGGFYARAQELSMETAEIFRNMSSTIMSYSPDFMSWVTTGLVPFIEEAVSLTGNIALGIWDSFNMILSDITENILPVFLETFINTILPLWTDVRIEWLETVGVLFDEIKEIFDKIYMEGISPALELIAKIWSEVCGTVKSVWDEYGAPIFESVREAITNTGDTLQNIWDTILKPIWDKFMEVVDEVWTNHLQPLLKNFLEFIAELVQGALDIYNGFILPVVNWLVDTFGPIFEKVFGSILDTVGAIIGNIIDAVSDVISALKGVIDFLVGVFTGDWERAWQGIQDFFKGIFDALEGIVKVPLNAVIGFINSMISAIVSGLNYVIDMINTLKFEVPDWVPLIGGSSWGFNFPNISAPSIPYLAQGAVLPANNPFLAVVGDQTSGTNIETPLATMIDAFNTALDSRGSGSTTVILEINKREFGRAVVDMGNQENTRRGVAVVY